MSDADVLKPAAVVAVVGLLLVLELVLVEKSVLMDAKLLSGSHHGDQDVAALPDEALLPSYIVHDLKCQCDR
ncbi:hypothetical protein GQ42DRAFT_165206 [Ramicandelaber brevisporus]|nr:hypothetical protein GQ42DRAFT_165206 [Ramicandelaber brevisporus]